jgi:hypothetical protein
MVHRQKKNSLPKGQLSGVTCGKIHGWKKVTRSIDTGILRLCCCLPAQNTHPRFRNKVAQWKRWPAETDTTPSRWYRPAVLLHFILSMPLLMSFQLTNQICIHLWCVMQSLKICMQDD